MSSETLSAAAYPSLGDSLKLTVVRALQPRTQQRDRDGSGS